MYYSVSRSLVLSSGRSKYLDSLSLGDEILTHRTRAVVIFNWEKPRNLAQLLLFLGTANFYRQFI